jgi:aquaporin NIP
VPTLGTEETFFIEFLITFILLFVIVAHAVDPKAVRQTSPTKIA